MGEGFGDMQLGSKINIFGNDGGGPVSRHRAFYQNPDGGA